MFLSYSSSPIIAFWNISIEEPIIFHLLRVG